MNQEVTTGMSEARSHQRRGKKTPTLITPKTNRRKAKGYESKECSNDDPPKRSITNVVKRSVPRLIAWSPRLHEASPLRKWRE